MAFGYLDALTAAASLAAGVVTANPAVGIGVNAALSGGKTYLQGGDASQIAQSAAISGATGALGAGAGAVGSEIGGEVGGQFGSQVGQTVAPVAMNAGIGALRGQSAEQIGEGAALGLAGKGVNAGIASIRDPNTNSGNAAGGPVHPRHAALLYAMGGMVGRRRKHFEGGGEAEGNDRGNDGGGGGGSGGGGSGGSSGSGGGGSGGTDVNAGDTRGSDVGDRAGGAAATGMGGSSDEGGGGYAVDTSDPANSLSGGVAGITGNVTDLNAVNSDDPGINSGTMTGGQDIGFGNVGAGGAEMGLANGVNAAATDDFGGWAAAKDFAPAPVSGGAYFGGTPNYSKEQGTDGGRGSEGPSQPGDMTNAPPPPVPGPPPGQTPTAPPPLQMHIPTVSDLVRPGTINPDQSGFGYSPVRYLAEGGRIGFQDEGYVDSDLYNWGPQQDTTPTYTPDLSSSSPATIGGYTDTYYPSGLDLTSTTPATPSPVATDQDPTPQDQATVRAANAPRSTSPLAVPAPKAQAVPTNLPRPTAGPAAAAPGSPEAAAPSKADAKGDSKGGKDDKDKDWWDRNKSWAVPAGIGTLMGGAMLASMVKGKKTSAHPSKAEIYAANPENFPKPSTVVGAPAGYRPGFDPEWSYIRYADGGRVGYDNGGDVSDSLSENYPYVQDDADTAYRRRVGQVAPYLSMAERPPVANVDYGQPRMRVQRTDAEALSRINPGTMPYYPSQQSVPQMRDPDEPYPVQGRSYTSPEDRAYDRALARSNTRPTDRPATQSYTSPEERAYDRDLARSNTRPMDRLSGLRSYDSQEDRPRTSRQPADVGLDPADRELIRMRAVSPGVNRALEDRDTRASADQPYTDRELARMRAVPSGTTRPEEDRDTRAPRPQQKPQRRAPRPPVARQQSISADELNNLSLMLSRARGGPPERQTDIATSRAPAALRTYYGLAQGGGIGGLAAGKNVGQMGSYERGIEGRRVMNDAEQALSNNHPDPQNAITRFRQYYGDDALATLMEKARKGNGLSDSVPATIDRSKEAALSSGEYVIPADVVSHLGNGSSQAGTRELDLMLARTRKARTGHSQQAPGINAMSSLPR